MARSGNQRSLRGRVAVVGIGETDYYRHGASPDARRRADIVVRNAHGSKAISATTHHQATDFSIFEGKTVRGIPSAKIVRLLVAYSDGQLRAQRGAGRQIKRHAFGTAFAASGPLQSSRKSECSSVQCGHDARRAYGRPYAGQASHLAERKVDPEGELHETVIERLKMSSVRNFTGYGPYRASLSEQPKAAEFYPSTAAEQWASRIASTSLRLLRHRYLGKRRPQSRRPDVACGRLAETAILVMAARTKSKPPRTACVSQNSKQSRR
jgi:hypothetical protein